MMMPLSVMTFSLLVQYFFQELTMKDHLSIMGLVLYKMSGSSIFHSLSDICSKMAELQKLPGFFPARKIGREKSSSSI